MSLGRGQTSTVSIVLAALSFAFFSVLIPALLVLRLTLTRPSKLYDETWTLLFLGPLYNHYRHGSQLFACLLFATNLAFGITIGCGQKNGTAQAIIILVIEVYCRGDIRSQLQPVLYELVICHLQHLRTNIEQNADLRFLFD